MRVAVLCEYSGVVRDAFIEKGHEAISCDLLPTDSPGPHIQGDCLDQDWFGYDLVIAHPPCQYLANSGVRWLHKQEGRYEKMLQSAEFFKRMLELPVPHIAVENSLPHGEAVKAIGRKYDFITHPWEHGEPYQKKTCFWTKNLPPLVPTQVTEERKEWILKLGPSDDRWKIRSKTFAGIAKAMAEQWGNLNG